MKNYSHRYSKYGLGLCIFVALFFFIQWGGGNGFLTLGKVEAKITPETIPFEEETAIFDKANPNVRAVIAVQNRHTPGLMGRPDVIGTATGLTEDGRPAILVLSKKGVGAGVIPESLEGVPVVVMVTGEIFSMAPPPHAEGRPSKVKIDPTATFTRPVPIGVSTGNRGECSAGTISARVKAGTNVYALSNNHVYALENDAPIGSEVLQPGLYDTECTYDPNNVIGTLTDYVPIRFDGSDNIVDAAIAQSSTTYLGNATPINGYGTPKSATVDPSLNQSVQKYGRTTSLTKGTVVGINVSVNVGYSSGTALFVNQILVYSRKAFIKAGDSGSLLVIYPDCNPVGLLFAGNTTGQYAFANQIDDVLNSFGVTIDGEE